MDQSGIPTIADWLGKILPIKKSLQHQHKLPTEYEIKIAFDKNGTLVILLGGIILLIVILDRIYCRSTSKESSVGPKPFDGLVFNVNEIKTHVSLNGVSIHCHSENTEKPIQKSSKLTPRSPKDAFQSKPVGLSLILTDFGSPNILHWSSLRKGDTPPHVYTKSFVIQKKNKQVVDTSADSEETFMESGMTTTRHQVGSFSGLNASELVRVEKWLLDTVLSLTASQLLCRLPEQSITRTLQVFDTLADSRETFMESAMTTTRHQVGSCSGRDATEVILVEKWLLDSVLSHAARQILCRLPEQSITGTFQITEADNKKNDEVN